MVALSNDDELPPIGFGASLALMLLVAGAMARWRFGLEIVSYGLFAASFTTLLTYTLFAGSRRPIYRGFERFTKPIRRVLSALVLALIYYALVTPIGLCLRWLGRGFVRLRQRQIKSNWQSRRETPKHDRYFDTY